MTAAASVAAAGMAFLVVVMMTLAVVVTFCFGVVGQLIGQQGCHCLIGIALHTAKEADTGLLQSNLGSAANAAADQGFHPQGGQKSCQSTVATACCADNNGICDFSVFNIVNLKVFGMSKMLEHLSVSVSDCNFHVQFLSFRKVSIIAAARPTMAMQGRWA